MGIVWDHRRDPEKRKNRPDCMASNPTESGRQVNPENHRMGGVAKKLAKPGRMVKNNASFLE